MTVHDLTALLFPTHHRLLNRWFLRLAIPVSAVLPTGQRNVVFLDKGEGKLEPRFVQIGRKYGDSYEVLSGVKEKDRVVTSANFLIDAEAKVQGALRSW